MPKREPLSNELKTLWWHKKQRSRFRAVFIMFDDFWWWCLVFCLVDSLIKLIILSWQRIHKINSYGIYSRQYSEFETECTKWFFLNYTISKNKGHLFILNAWKKKIVLDILRKFWMGRLWRFTFVKFGKSPP